MFSCIEHCRKMIAYFGRFLTWRAATHRKIMLYFSALLHVASISQEDNASFRSSSSRGKHLAGRSCFISTLFFTWQAARRKIMPYFDAFLYVASNPQED